MTRFAIISTALFLLAGCSTYKVKVDLPANEIADIKAQITLLKQDITEFVPSADEAIAWASLIELSNAYEDLGELGKAIKVYEDVLDDGHVTKAILNNLGRLYEKTEQYDEAVAMYQRINDEYFDHDYLYDITWAYIRAGERKQAEKYFNAWQLEFQKTDTQTQQAIKKLREEEKQGNS